MATNPIQARAAYRKSRDRFCTAGDRLTARAWDAVQACLIPTHPGMTIPEALRAGIVTAQELTAAHAWAARTNVKGAQ